MKVINEVGTKIIFDVAVMMMDEYIREELHAELSPCSEQEFFNAYAKMHAALYGEPWELAKSQPVY